MCGRLAAPQRGQLLREGAMRRQFEARRIRVFDFEVFFFGTATVVSLHVRQMPHWGLGKVISKTGKVTGLFPRGIL